MGTVQKISYTVLGILITGGSITTFADDLQVNRSWFGNTGATAEPVKDVDGSGHWWWPTVPASNDNDQELWGNRGVVYSQYSPDRPGVIIACPGPPPPPPPPQVEDTVTRNIPIPNKVLFDFDSAVLKPEGQKEVAKIAKMLKEYPMDTVIVEGHTCDMGPDVYNLQLSKRRAQSVAKALIGNGIDASRVTSFGYGETKPVAENTSRANRMQNRRVVILFKIK